VKADLLGYASTLAQQAGTPQPAKTAENRQAAEQFEAYMVELMIREMRKTVPEGLLASGGAELFSGLLDREIASSIAGAGGFGLAEALEADMKADGANPLRTVREPGSARVGGRRAPFAGPSLPTDGSITSRFGRRADPFTGERRFHQGLDIGAGAGSPIRAIDAGVVTMAAERPGLGRVVVVEHAQGWTSLYAHCEALDVVPGQQVAAGEEIATVGSSGRSTGPHLHLELHHQGRAVDPQKAMGWR